MKFDKGATHRIKVGGYSLAGRTVKFVDTLLSVRSGVVYLFELSPGDYLCLE